MSNITYKKTNPSHATVVECETGNIVKYIPLYALSSVNRFLENYLFFRNFSKYWYHFWDFRYGNCYIFNSGINQTILETQTTGPFGGTVINSEIYDIENIK